MGFPKVYLAIDNCFASKRWTRPGEWARIARDVGLSCVEASADNECDPLYADPAFLADWLNACRAAVDDTGVRVVNFYSGHGTYATLGMGHTDVRCRDRIQHEWLERMIDNAASLGAGLGFYCHAFSQATLDDPARFGRAEADLYDRLAALAGHAAQGGARTIGVEQMYSPHQIPWTIRQAERMLREVWSRGGHPLHLTLDCGHQVGQRRFGRPAPEEIARRVEEGNAEGLWLGPMRAYAMFGEAEEAGGAERQARIGAMCGKIDMYPYLFSTEEDGDLYAWARRVGRYSPIVHLQQTDGQVSSHWPFTDECNARGLVRAGELIEALAESYDAPDTPDMPPAPDELYLTLELFAGTADLPIDILASVERSVAYWRQFVPEDGRRLNEIVATLH
jgi:sugar phosphate isomerase/epimerase